MTVAVAVIVATAVAVGPAAAVGLAFIVPVTMTVAIAVAVAVAVGPSQREWSSFFMPSCLRLFFPGMNKVESSMGISLEWLPDDILVIADFLFAFARPR